MRKFLESWGGALAIVATVAGAAWLIATSIGQVRTDLTAEIVSLEVRMEKRLGAVEAKMSAVEAKLDLLIEALDISAGEDQ